MVVFVVVGGVVGCYIVFVDDVMMFGVMFVVVV